MKGSTEKLEWSHDRPCQHPGLNVTCNVYSNIRPEMLAGRLTIRAGKVDDIEVCCSECGMVFDKDALMLEMDQERVGKGTMAFCKYKERYLPLTWWSS